jgi:hypothetical protein
MTEIVHRDLAVTQSVLEQWPALPRRDAFDQSSEFESLNYIIRRCCFHKQRLTCSYRNTLAAGEVPLDSNK